MQYSRHRLMALVAYMTLTRPASPQA